MAGFENGVMVGKNLNFDEQAASPHFGIIDAAGKFPIGSGNLAPTAEILGGTVVSPLGTLTIGYVSPNITIDINTAGPILMSINVQTGTTPITAIAGAITVGGSLVAAGSSPVKTYGTGASSFTTNIQTSQAIASTDATKVGLCAFNSGQFTVDANGFVSSIGEGLNWSDVTGTTQAVTKSFGYVSNNAGTVTFTLPASSTIGDVFRIVGLQGAWTLAQNANQQVKFGSSATTVGIGGSITSTDAGDCLELVATNTSASSVWACMSAIGNLTIV